MIVVVTGSSGFIGSRLVKKLKRLNHNVIEIDIQNGFDIMDFKQLKTIKKFDVCVHLAGLTFVPLSYEKPHEFFSLNVYGLINCIELCKIHNAKMVFSSSYVYGEPKYLPIDEKHPVVGFNPYAETKLIGETICRAYNKYFGIKSIILRPSNIYGPGQNKNFLLPIIIKQAKDGSIILKDPRPKRDFIFVDDVVECFIKAIEDDSLSFEIFNVGYGKSYSVNEVVEIVNQLYDNSLSINYTNERREIEILDTSVEISKVKSLLGWSPKIDLHSGLEISINFNA